MNGGQCGLAGAVCGVFCGGIRPRRGGEGEAGVIIMGSDDCFDASDW